MGRAHLALGDHHAMAQVEMRLVVAAHPGRHLVGVGPRMGALPGVLVIGVPQLEGLRMGLGVQQWR